MREAVETITAAVEAGAPHLRARRLRRRRDLRDGARASSCCASSAPTSPGTCPSRFEEGYGLNGQTLTRLADEGFDLVLTVDCGITAVAEVAHARIARARGGRHRPPPARPTTFPACPVVAPLKGDYPFTGLCGTGVVWKLAEALLGAGHPFLERHLDVVALATVADVVPLVDENRALALLGLRRLAQTQKPGLRALMQVSGVDPAALDESCDRVPARAADQRVGPPLPARGGARAAPHRGRRRGEAARRGARDAEPRAAGGRGADRCARRSTQIESWPEARRRRRGYVVAGEDWHEGVIGIVASRLVERYNRPVVLIAGSGGDWKGSGRSVAAFDLHGGLAACAGHLERFGGHRAAAGLSIEAERVETFAAAFAAHADAVLTDDDLQPRHARRRDRPGAKLGLDLCAELGRLAPFGLGNPGVTLLVDGCELAELSTVGDGKHLRFRVRQHGRDAGSAIAFGMGGAARPASAARSATTSRSGSRRTAGTARSRRSSSCGASSTPPTGYDELRDWLADAVARRARPPGRPRRGGSSPSSSSAAAASGACSSRRRSGRCSSMRPALAVAA